MKKSLAIILAAVMLMLTPISAAAENERFTGVSDWAREGVQNAEDLKILYNDPTLPFDAGRPITRGQFAEQAASLAAVELGSNLESYLVIMTYRGQAETDDYYRLYALDVAVSLGILKGRGEGVYAAYDHITRQEAAVMLARTFRAYQGIPAEGKAELSYTDINEVADWALSDVRLMSQLGIMNGVGDGRFDPLGAYTVEQCLVSLVRLHENAPYGGGRTENPFAIPEIEGGFFKTGDVGFDIAFAIETVDYYICARHRPTVGSGIGYSYYDIIVIEQDFSLRSYPTAIISASSFRGDYHVRPENPSLSEDGTKLIYTAVLQEDAYSTVGVTGTDKTLIFQKGVYTVTMDLATGEQTWTRTDLPQSDGT